MLIVAHKTDNRVKLLEEEAITPRHDEPCVIVTDATGMVIFGLTVIASDPCAARAA